MDQLANRAVHELNELHHVLVENGADILALLNENGTFLYCVGSSLRNLGHYPEQLLGKEFFNFVHPEDKKKAEEVWVKLLNSKDDNAIITDLRFQAADGKWRWLEKGIINYIILE